MKINLQIVSLGLALLTGCKIAPLHEATRNRSKGLTPPNEFIQFGFQKFYCEFFDQNDESWVKEYLPKDHTLQNWKELISIRNLKTIDSPEKYIQSMVTQYRREYPSLSFAVIERSEPQQWGIDFIAFAKDNKVTVEWNCFLAEKSKNGSGIIVYQYAMREFSFSAFGENFPERRSKLLSMILESDFNVQKVSAK